MFDLQDDVRVERTVEWMKVVVGGARPIVLGITPVHQVVVDEAAIEDHAFMRCERSCDHVGRVCVRAVVRRRTESALGVGLQNNPAKIGNRPIQGIDPILPERRDASVQRVERVQAANTSWAAEVH